MNAASLDLFNNAPAMTDEQREAAIQAELASLAAAPNYEAARPHSARMSELIKGRSKKRVEAMERERGLRR